MAAVRLAALAALLLPLSGAWAESGGAGVKFNPENETVPAFRDAIEADDAARKRRAEEEGESFSVTFDRPTQPVTPAVGPAAVPAEAPAAPEAAEPPPEARQVVDAPSEPPRSRPPAAQYREGLPERGGQRDRGGDASPIDALLEVLNQPVGKAAWLEYARETVAEDGRSGPAQDRAAPVLPAALRSLAVGRGLYARTLYEANSDWPGPVVLELLEPPLAGATATGSFQEAN
ncbi:MAG: hypothetical protein F4X35_09085 [Alphaproteobacteria bacterium]|nr:hypothetical protein [Alphaproteobacteria bacterium]